MNFCFLKVSAEKKVCFPSGLIKISDFLPLSLIFPRGGPDFLLCSLAISVARHRRKKCQTMEPFPDGGGGYDDVPANIEVPKQ